MTSARPIRLFRPALAGLFLAGALLSGPALAQQAAPADPVPSRPAPSTETPAPATSPVVSPQVAPPLAAPKPEDALKSRAEQTVTEEALKDAEAQAPGDAERAAACKAHALARLKANSPSVDDILIDMDGLTIAKADTTVGQEKITAVLMGEAYIKRDRSDKAHRFLCLVGENDKVVMTFFTTR
ncbi:MAG: hypothetical protein J0I31_17555 [Rhizobiales bacterium]|nr:hypothetical protein [Hyphomicrobiales bacterium]